MGRRRGKGNRAALGTVFLGRHSPTSVITLAAGWCIRVLVRALLAICPPGKKQSLAIQELRQSCDSIEQTHLAPNEHTALTLWTSGEATLRNSILHSDPRAFLTWRFLRDTMLVSPFARFVRSELAFLRAHDWSRWKPALREPILPGIPTPCLYYPLRSATAIHHAYHLCRLEQEARRPLHSFGGICEFGAGFGSLCRIAHRAGFDGRYLIYDLPVACALQRYYLSATGIAGVSWTSDLESLAAKLQTLEPPRLFIATWSLSESPLEVRKTLAAALRDFDSFLLAYQENFFGINNRAFFDLWQSWFPEISWKEQTIAQLPGHHYLFGIRLR
jgi:hypothetical protein